MAITVKADGSTLGTISGTVVRLHFTSAKGESGKMFVDNAHITAINILSGVQSAVAGRKWMSDIDAVTYPPNGT